ncbi:MAG TPA: flagellar biosynthetic protein FliR [Rhodanobacteraceae bacterium]|nr:flagellar biosynthetic protein FliR [Rhodanobacteraceae bacterium]
MNLDVTQLQAFLAAFLWPFARVSGLLLTAPVLGASALPVRVRAGLAVILTLVLMPLAPKSGGVDVMSLNGFATVLQQVVVGAAMGFALALAFAALTFAGSLVTNAMGLSFAQVASPLDGHDAPALGELYALLATLIFLALDGHLELISLLATGMRHASWAAPMPGGAHLWQLLQFGAHLFSGAVMVALPALAALLIADAGFGVISRAAPAMNLFSIGFPISIALGFVGVWIGLVTLPGAFATLRRAAFALVRVLAGA